MPAAYRAGMVRNDHAACFRTIGTSRRSYVFSYDDINDQASVRILDDSAPPPALPPGTGR